MKKIIALLISVTMLLAFAACGGSDESSSDAGMSTTENSSTSSVSEEEPLSPPPAPYTNPLTGEGCYTDISANRPYVIMLNTIKQALPQSGNSQADLYYEMVEEGGITRVMGVYQDITDVGILGSIRSTRQYYVQLTLALDGFLVHAGGSREGLDEITNLGLRTVNALGAAGGIFYRDQTRLNSGFALEHTMFVTSDDLQDWVDNTSGYRTEHEDGYADSHSHKFVEDGTPDGGEQADVITVPFSGYKNTVFTYDDTTGKYDVNMFDSAYIDEQNGEQVSVTNVLILNTEIYTKANSRMSIAITGSGEGYYACGGEIIPITWSKANYSDMYTLTTADGDELEFGVGKTYICIIGLDNSITVE